MIDVSIIFGLLISSGYVDQRYVEVYIFVKLYTLEDTCKKKFKSIVNITDN